MIHTMKHLLFILIVAGSSLCFIQSDEFKANFKRVFLQSIQGLASLKGATVDGGNTCTIVFAEFDKALVTESESIGSLGVVMTKEVDSEEKGLDLSRKPLSGEHRDSAVGFNASAERWG